MSKEEKVLWSTVRVVRIRARATVGAHRPGWLEGALVPCHQRAPWEKPELAEDLLALHKPHREG